MKIDKTYFQAQKTYLHPQKNYFICKKLTSRTFRLFFPGKSIALLCLFYYNFFNLIKESLPVSQIGKR